MTRSWRTEQSDWPPEYQAGPVEPRTVSPPDPGRNNAAAEEFSRQSGRQQRDNVTTASARMSPTPADGRTRGGDDNERIVEDDVRMAEQGDEAGGVVSGGNPGWGAPWQRSHTPDALKHDNYDPMRYKTNAGRDRWAADTARTSAGVAADAAPSAAVPNAGDWNGAASSSGPRVNWAQDYLEPSERRSMPSRGQLPPPRSSSLLHDDSPATAAAAEERQGGVASRPTGALTNHPVRVDNGDEKRPYSNRNSSNHPYSSSNVERGSYSNDPEGPPYPKGIGEPVRSQADWKLTQSDGAISRRVQAGDGQQRYSTSSLTNTGNSDDKDPRTIRSNYQARGAYPRPAGEEVDVAGSGQRGAYDERVSQAEGAGGSLAAGAAAAARLEAVRASAPSGVGGIGGKVEHVLRDGRRVVLFANGTQKAGGRFVFCLDCCSGTRFFFFTCVCQECSRQDHVR